MLIKKRILSINVSHGSQNDFLHEIFLYNEKRQPAYVCFANVHMLVEAHDSNSFSNVVRHANIVAPDGFPVAKSFKFLHGLKQNRIDGLGIMIRVLTCCQKNAKKVYFYGGTQQMLNSAGVHLEKHYPGVVVAGMHAPPFRPLQPNEKEAVIADIKASGADFVFVALGCPKQEAWMHEVSARIPTVMLGIGGALPMMLGIQQRAPQWLQKIGFEWFYRLIQEPRRLFQRYAITNCKFIWMLSSELLKIKLARIWPSLLSRTV